MSPSELVVESVSDSETVSDLPTVAFTSVSSERIEHRRDWVATLIAAALLVFFAFAYFGPMVIWAVTGRAPPEALTASLEKAAAAVGSLLGTIVGFYFSEKRLRR